MKITRLYRHPVKGLRPETLNTAEFLPERGMAGDRAFAFQFMDESVPEELRAIPAETAPWMSKFHLAVQHDWPELAQWVPHLDLENKRLRLTGPGGLVREESLTSPEGRENLSQCIHDFLKTSAPFARARHPQVAPLRLVGAPDQSSRYTDGNAGPITLLSEETLADLAAKAGIKELDPRRFRMNLIFSGATALAEQKWIGRKLKVGQVVLEILKPVGRCANIDVHPETGARDGLLLSQLIPLYGHGLVGMRAHVIQGGRIRIGDELELI